MKSKDATGFPAALGFFLLSFAVVGCTLALDRTAVQCRSDKDCLGKKPDAASLVCRRRVCVVVDTDAGKPSGESDAALPDLPVLPFAVDQAFFTSGYMGDGERGLIKEYPCPSGKRGGEGRGSCHLFIYEAGPTAKGWGGVYWQHPANNWNNKGDGYLIPVGAQSVAFYAWASATTPAFNFAIGILQADGFEIESSEISLGPSPSRYLIDLGGASYDRVVGAFSFNTLAPSDGSTALYVDDIVWSGELARVATTFVSDTRNELMPSDCGLRLRGSFDSWGIGVVMQDDNKDGVYRVSVELAPNQEVQYRFAKECEGGVLLDETLSQGAFCAPATFEGTPARLFKVPHEDSALAPKCFADCGSCGVESPPPGLP